MSRPNSDGVVIGGGIVGTSAAAFLAEAGARVTLVVRERAPPPRVTGIPVVLSKRTSRGCR